MNKNIFDDLADSDSEEQQKQTKTSQPKNRQKTKKEKPILPENESKIIGKESQKVSKSYKEHQKGVSAQPHPLDKRSGTGHGKESKKGGGGHNNWGNYKDDLKEQGKEVKNFYDEGEKNEAEEKKEEIKYVTLDQYKEQNNWKQVTEEEKANKVDLKAFAESEKLEIVQKSKIDDKTEKRENKASDYVPTFKSEHSELLGLNVDSREGKHKKKRFNKDNEQQQEKQQVSTKKEKAVNINANDEKQFPSLG